MKIKNHRIKNVFLLIFIAVLSGTLVSCGSDSTGPNGMKCKDLPSNFPNAIPVYKPSCVKVVLTKNMGLTSVTFSSKSSSNAIANFYEKKLSGWKDYSKMSAYGATVIQAKKGNLTVTVSIGGKMSNSKEDMAFSILYGQI